MRAGKQWGVLALLLGCLTASAKPPETPVKPVIDGKVLSPLAQDHFQTDLAVRPLSVAATIPVPPKYLPPVVESLAVLIPAAIRAVSDVADTAVREMKGRAAFEMAEMHFNACDMNEACRWFKAVESLSPGSPYARTAVERIARIRGAEGESAEPPLAD